MTALPPDIEIAQKAELLPIDKVAEQAGLKEEEWRPYGRHAAKVSLDALSTREDTDDGKLTPKAARRLLDVYQRQMDGYTYLGDDG